MSCDNWTYCTAIVDLTPRSSLASDVDDYATPAEASSPQGRHGLTADRSKLKGHRHVSQSRIIPDSTQVDPEYVWSDEGPIND
jgi:hypothetical protein